MLAQPCYRCGVRPAWHPMVWCRACYAELRKSMQKGAV